MKSELWKRITDKYEKNFDLDNFRNSSKESINNRFASWAPNEATLRWYKSFLLCIANMAPIEEIALYLKISRSNLGNPITARICNCENESFKVNFLDVNLDYLLAVHETSFLQKNSNMEFQKIVEIGGGIRSNSTCTIGNNRHH